VSIFPRPGAAIHYVHAGAGEPALVFIHGALCDHRDWVHQLEHFARTNSVVALDLRGHGESRGAHGTIGVLPFAQDVHALCDALSLARVVLVGHSMGCRVVLQALQEIGSPRVCGLVLVDGAYLVPQLLTGVTREQRETLVLQAQERAGKLYEGGGPALRAVRGFGQMFFDPRFDEVRDRMIERAASLPGEIARELMPDFASWDIRHMEDALARVDVPVLAIACTYMNASHERCMLSEGQQTQWLQALQTHVPHAQVIRYAGHGHFPMIEAPDRVNEDLERFIADLA